MHPDLQVYFDDLADPDREGCTSYLYCDNRGFVTVGIGNLVATPDACCALPFRRKDGTAATDDEKRDAWKGVIDAFDKSHLASFYRGLNDLRLTTDFVAQLAQHRIDTEFVPGIIDLCPDFDAFPLPARRALVDMAYNLGLGGLAKFHHMLAACNARDFATAAGQCHRVTCRDSRNAWTASMFIDAEVTPTPTS